MRANLRPVSLLIALILAVSLFSVTSCKSSSGSSGNDDDDDDVSVAAPAIKVTGSGVARKVSISCGTSGAAIHYTTDGTTPTSSSSTYSSKLTVAGFGVTKTIKAVAVKSGESSKVSTKTVSIGSALSITGDTVSTIATVNASYGIFGVTTDDTNLYITTGLGIDGASLDVYEDYIWTVSASGGAATVLAGDGTGGEVDSATATSAEFDYASGITTDGDNLYIADNGGCTIRKLVLATGEVTTLAGDGTVAEKDGTGKGAEFYYPLGITTDGTNLYVTDNCTIRKVAIATGEVTTLAGDGNIGHQDGTGTAAEFSCPFGITTDGTNLYVTDAGDSRTIRKVVIATGEVTTLAGEDGATREVVDGTGSEARFYSPIGIATDGTNLYVTEPSAGTLRKIVISSAQVTTLITTQDQKIGNDAYFMVAGSSCLYIGGCGVSKVQ
jgi:hypothetical protein